MRGAKARKRAREKRTEREYFKNRTEAQRRSKFGVASIVIERVYRGHGGRKLAQLRRIERAEQAAQHLIMRHKKAARIQSMFKGCDCSSTFSQGFVVTNREGIVFATRFESADGESTW